MRRPGVGSARRMGARGIGGGAVPFSPLAPANLGLLWWDPTIPGAGAVASWADRIAGVAATQGTGAAQPTKSATAISSAYPGVSFDGGDLLAAAGAGAVLSGKTTLTVTAVMVDTVTAASVALELTADSNANNGGFGLFANDGAAGRVNGSIRGTVAVTERYVTESLAAVKVVSIGYDFATAGAGAVSFIRVNGVAGSLTNQLTSSVAGSAANATLFFGARSGIVAPWTGVYGDVYIRNSVAQDSTLAQLERYFGARVGLSW